MPLPLNGQSNSSEAVCVKSAPNGLFLQSHGSVELLIAATPNVSLLPIVYIFPIRLTCTRTHKQRHICMQNESFKEGDRLLSAGGYTLFGRPVPEQVGFSAL